MTKSASPGERVARRLVRLVQTQPCLHVVREHYAAIGFEGRNDKEARQYLREIRAIIASAVDAEIKRSKKR